MGIQNFPTALQPIIQLGYLERRFHDGLRSRLGYRDIAEKMTFATRIGETITATKTGYKAPVTTPLNPTTNTNFDNGITPSGWAVEQYQLSIAQYGDGIDLNEVTEGVGIANQFLKNAEVNGVQAAQSLDRMARNALYFGATPGLGGYLSGNTRVTVTLGTAGTAVKVDNIAGFINTLSSVGQVVTVTNLAGMTVVVGSNTYTLAGAVADTTNVSSMAAYTGNASGTLNFTTAVSVADAAAGNAVVASIAPYVVRPNGKLTTAALVSASGTYQGGASAATGYSPGDTLNIQVILAAVAQMRSNNVPTASGGFYNFYLSDRMLLALFKDNDFKLLYQSSYGSTAYVSGQIIELLGVRYIPNTEVVTQVLGGVTINRGILCGSGALIEGTFAGQGNTYVDRAVSIMHEVDKVMMVTREPLDRFGQIISQAWYWIGGYALPTDSTANTTIIPTASNSALKRAIVVECAA